MPHPATPRAPELALARALELAAAAVALAGPIATLVGLLGGRDVAAGIAVGSVLAVVMMWVTRVAVLRTRAAPLEQIGVWVLLSYAAKFVLIVVVTLLVGRADSVVDKPAYALTLLVGVVVSVAAQARLSRPGATLSVAARSTVPATAYDDDAAAVAARTAGGAAPGGAPVAPVAPGKVSTR